MFNTQLGNIAGERANCTWDQRRHRAFLSISQCTKINTTENTFFSIAQIGKAFRNEIVARQFIFRMRVWTNEMQFSSGQEEMQWYEYWKATRMKWHLNLGTPQSKLRFHDHDNLAHYANAAVDIQFDFSFWFQRIGRHSQPYRLWPHRASEVIG